MGSDKERHLMSISELCAHRHTSLHAPVGTHNKRPTAKQNLLDLSKWEQVGKLRQDRDFQETILFLAL